MSSSVKRVTNLIINFIDQTLIPIIFTTPDTLNAMHQWAKLKAYCLEDELIESWKLEKFICDLSTNTLLSIPKLTIEVQEPTNLGVRSSFSELESWKSPITSSMEADKKGNHTIPPNSYDINKNEEKIDHPNGDFDNLLASFKKLCTNFETNHKKLVIDKEAFAH